MIGMRRFVRLFALIATSAALGAWALFGIQRLVGPRVTTTRLSPDETIRAQLIEVSPPWYLDRNVSLRLEDRASGRTTSLMPHLDGQGHPEGTERLIWSKDGAWLLLVGRHFFVREDLFLDNGDQPYFLHHLPSRRSWINSDLAGRMTDLPPLKAEQLAGIEFTEPVVLKPR